MNLADYNRLKEAADRLQREEDRTRGALDQLNARVNEEFGVDLTAAKKLLAKLDRQVAEAERDYQQASQEFEDKWKERLE